MCVCVSVDRVYLSLADNVEAYKEKPSAEKAFIMGLIAEHVEMISDTQPSSKLLKALIERVTIVNVYEEMKLALEQMRRTRRTSYLKSPKDLSFSLAIRSFVYGLGTVCPPYFRLICW